MKITSFKERSFLIKDTFKFGEFYTRKDIKRLIGVPEERGGDWNTGYVHYNNDYFIFVNLGTPGRVGEDHGNKMIDNYMEWFAKKKLRTHHNTFKNLLNPKGSIHMFTRYSSKNIYFKYLGQVRVKKYFDEHPVRIIWRFIDEFKAPDEIDENTTYIEGTTKKVTINIYERNLKAREDCLSYHGLNCSVCNFNFSEEYGEIGEDYIHVHHLIPLSEIGEDYKINPIKDLRPVCPNCHVMLHKNKPPYTIEELQNILLVNMKNKDL